MKQDLTKRLTICLMIVLLITISSSSVFARSHGHARGRHRGRGHNRIHPNQGKKADKFVNGHDARDGRRDGKGPRHR